jgi:hypothetical protein
MTDFGQQHLFAAKKLIRNLVKDTSAFSNNDCHSFLCLGIYLYWDMSTAFLVHPDEQQQLDTIEISIAVHKMGNWHHPMYGSCTELLFILANVARYDRLLLESEQRNLTQETGLERGLCEWAATPPTIVLGHLYEAWRTIGFVFLYTVSGWDPSFQNPDLVNHDLESLISHYTRESIWHLMKIPVSSNYLNF